MMDKKNITGIINFHTLPTNQISRSYLERFLTECKCNGKIDRQTEVLTDGIYEAMFSYFGYLCGYFPLCGLDTQQTNLATLISNLRKKSHLYSKMYTSVSNCPNL